MTDTPDFDPTAFGQRLQRALEEKGWSIKPFQEALVERTGKAPGTSYGSVYGYVKGMAPVVPRQEVSDAMAELLGLTPRYLLFGAGPKSSPREAEEAATRSSVLESVEEDFAQGFGEGAGAVLDAGLLRATITRTWWKLMSSDYGDRLWHEDTRALGKGLGRILRRSLDDLGIQPGEVSEAALTEYVISVCQGLRHLAERPAPPSKSIRAKEPE